MAFVAVVVTRVRVCLPPMTNRYVGCRRAMLVVVFHRGLLRVNAVMLAIFHESGGLTGA
jgi:hypothetical protein